MAIQIPSGLCPTHHDAAIKWRNNRFNRHHPREWGGGPLMDNRTSYADKDAEFERKNADQIQLIAEICQRRTSCPPEDEWDAIRSEIMKRYT